MDLPINANPPLLMHIDLNSCFATVEQQVNSTLRGKPLVIAAYTSPGGCIVSPSIEAKKLGIKTGMSVREARLIEPKVIVRDPDPMLVRDVHLKFKRIFQTYTPDVTPKSIDEAILDFTSMQKILRRELLSIAREIKARLRSEIGEWISCNVGIGTNRFLAKLAAGLHKPDGLDLINHHNLLCTYQSLTLTDLPGINTRFQARLNANSIFTPDQFLHSSLPTLKNQVFQSIAGYYWYQRLRGYEVDSIDPLRKSYGQDYSLGAKTADPHKLSQYLLKLCEKMGRRLRRAGFCATGIHVGVLFADGTWWHRGKKFHTSLFTTQELFVKTLLVFNSRPNQSQIISKLSVSCYDLESAKSQQADLFETTDKSRALSSAIDKINDKWGEFVVTPALMLGMDHVVIDRISFGGVRELEDWYEAC